jgi:branched-chain amino acid transport system substrate-binding protein
MRLSTDGAGGMAKALPIHPPASDNTATVAMHRLRIMRSSLGAALDGSDRPSLRLARLHETIVPCRLPTRSTLDRDRGCSTEGPASQEDAMQGLHRAKLLALALVWIWIGPAAARAETDTGNRPSRTARIAALLDLEGAQATLGRPAMNGFVLGLQEGAKDGVLSFSALLDTQSSPQVTATAARDVARSVSIAAGFTDTDSILIAGPFFQRARVPFLSIGATDPSLPEVVGDRIFLTPFGDNTQAAAAAEFGERAFGHSVAILWDSTSRYTRTLPRYFRTRFEELGGDVALDASYASGCDISALGEQVQALPRRPDFVYLAGLPDCIGRVVASLRAAGVTQPIVGGDGLDTPELLATGAGPTDDVWFTTHVWLSEETGTPATREFMAAYRTAYGANPEDAFAALGYDAARLILDVLSRARNDAHLFEALEQTEGFPGVTGTISFSAASHVPSKTVWVIAVQDGEKSLASHFVPDSVPPPIVDAR